MEIIGRQEYKRDLRRYYESEFPEFVAVYGRRRVGKTFLIREFFRDKFAFYVTGLAKEDKKGQLANFNDALNKYGKMPYPRVQSWVDAFRQLIHLLENSKIRGKKVIFIDELSWFDTPRAKFMTGLEAFWNGWASSRPDILLIVCASASSWMTNKLINNHGGLHNRVTRIMPLEQFSLRECEDFFKSRKIVLGRREIVESYMIFGGIPFYINMFDGSLSLAQNVDKLCFSKNGALRNEFSNLYASLFQHSENYIAVVKALNNRVAGLTRKEISKTTKLQGGGLTNILDDLDKCGFIRKYHAFSKKSKYTIYQLVDFYTLFYFHFIQNTAAGRNFWATMLNSSRHAAWSGYAFEQVCLQHEEQIKQRLGIAGVHTNTASWRSQKEGAQIDLVIDRDDRVINLCEMKYADNKFVISKEYAETLRNKRTTFINETKTRKAVHLTMVTTYGLKRNVHSGEVQSEILMEDLFC
ncbi:MAG: ATP-binding protein [Tannerella sp.]|jgi:AAA+ ATPase superfamily predicted ATPase|nr:ATP-binding protein [Tannerella sp.]